LTEVTLAGTVHVYVPAEEYVWIEVGETVKFTPLLGMPPTVTTTFPDVTPLGTVTPMLLVLQLVTLAAVPLKVTVLAPRVDPKLLPAIVTGIPIGPEIGERPVITGVGITVKFTPLLATPPTVTTTLPLIAGPGTVTAMLLVLQVVAVACVPLKVTVLAHW
jgi:hypothetical protein